MQSTRRLAAASIALCLIVGHPVSAYELKTHEAITVAAVEQSNLESVNGYLFGLGIAPEKTFQHVTVYPIGLRDESPKKWIRDGARDEDNQPIEGPLRVRHHFYNPLTGQGYTHLQAPGIPNRPAPDWALEDSKGQVFSWLNARDHFYQGLIKPQPANRDDELAQAFYTLGHVIHLIQDMAQPQHTRDDSHAKAAILSAATLGLLPTFAQKLGIYEQYADLRSGALPLAGYDPVYRDQDTTTFNKTHKFFTTLSPPTLTAQGGKGLADYSNRGFVSAGTNFCAANPSVSCAGSTIPPSVLQPYEILPHPGFPYPNGQGASIVRERIEDLAQPQFGPPPAANLTGDIDFIVTSVYDAYTGQRNRNLTSTYSIFDPDLQAANQQLTFTLNRYNFDDALDLLIPRAVGYSAGMINYFFRGAFSIYSLDSDRGPFFVRNRTGEPMNGTFQIYWDDASGNRQPVGLAQTIPVAAHSESPFEFAFAPDPTIDDYTVVFRGTLGNEVDSAVAATQITVASAPIVDVTLSQATASDPQNDLASYSWLVTCVKHFDDGTFSLLGPSNITGASGSLSGGYAVVPFPGYDRSNLADECILYLTVLDSHGHAGADGISL
jgi:hypothetical protein